MSAPRTVVWKDRDPGEDHPWVVSFLDYERPGVELYAGRSFRSWAKAIRWADRVARGESELQPGDLCPGSGQPLVEHHLHSSVCSRCGFTYGTLYPGDRATTHSYERELR